MAEVLPAKEARREARHSLGEAHRHGWDGHGDDWEESQASSRVCSTYGYAKPVPKSSPRHSSPGREKPV